MPLAVASFYRPNYHVRRAPVNSGGKRPSSRAAEIPRALKIGSYLFACPEASRIAPTTDTNMATSDRVAPAVQSSRKISAGKLALVCILAVLLLFLALFALGSFISSWQLQAELDKIRAAGEPVTVADQEAFYARPPQDRDTTELWLDAFTVLDSPGYQSDAMALPIVGEKDLPIGNNDAAPLPGEPWPQLDAAAEFLAKYREPLEKMHQAAEMGGEARFPLKFSDGVAMALPYQQLRCAVRLLKLESEVRAHRGDSRAAAESVRAMFAAARTFERQSIIVSQLLQIAMNGVACDQIERLLPAIEFSEQDLIQFDRELAAIDELAAFRRTLLGERAMLRHVFANPSSLGTEAPHGWSLLRKADETTYLMLAAKQIAAARSNALPLRDAISQAQDEVTSFLRAPKTRWRFPITFEVMRDLNPIVDCVYKAQARHAATRTAIAIERYRSKTGAAPKTLDQLVPEFLEKPPVDPFDGAPLRYHSDAAGYKVYSIGPDGIDQGGEPGVEGKELDIVFEVPL